jgi:hypothetical protein
MAQVVGFPGGGFKLSKGISIFTGTGDPNNSTTKDVQQAQIGSLYLRVDGPDATHILYVCSVSAIRQSPTQSATNSVWTPK